MSPTYIEISGKTSCRAMLSGDLKDESKFRREQQGEPSRQREQRAFWGQDHGPYEERI